MTDAYRLADESQKKVIAFADGEIADSRAGIKRNLVRFGVAAAVTAGIFATLPFTTLPIIAGGIAGGFAMIFGGYAASHYVNTREMEAVKREAGDEGFTQKVKERAERAARFHRRMDYAALAGVATFCAASFALLAFPAAAPVLGAVKLLGSVAWLGGLFGKSSMEEAEKSTRMLEHTVNRIMPLDDLVASLAPSNGNKPAGLSHAPAPAADFGRAANGNDPAITDDTPRKTPPALKM